MKYSPNQLPLLFTESTTGLSPVVEEVVEEPTNSRPGYKHTALGWIPQDWEVKKIEEVAYVKGGFAFDSSKFLHKGLFQVVKMSNLYDDVLDLSRSQSFLNEISQQEKEYLVKEHDIIITLTGTVGKRDYGYSYHVSKEKNLLLNQRVARLVSKPAILDSSFLSYRLKSNQFLNQFFYSARGGTGNQANVGTIDLCQIKISLPPLPEQKAIAAVLYTWDKAIEKIQVLVAAKEQRKKWLMGQLLTGKKRLPGFGGEWEEYSYGQILREVKRPVKWDDKELYDLISVRRRSGGLFHRESLYGHQILTKNLRTVQRGDFLISKMQIVHGASGLTTEEFDGMKVSGSYIAVVAKDPSILNMNFFNLLSKTPYFYHQTYISSFGVHIEKMTFDFESFMSLEAKIPPVQEQTAIAAILQAADREIRLLKQKLEKLKEQKKGLMQVLLMGKVRVKCK